LKRSEKKDSLKRSVKYSSDCLKRSEKKGVKFILKLIGGRKQNKTDRRNRDKEAPRLSLLSKMWLSFSEKRKDGKTERRKGSKRTIRKGFLLYFMQSVQSNCQIAPSTREERMTERE